MYPFGRPQMTLVELIRRMRIAETTVTSAHDPSATWQRSPAVAAIASEADIRA